MSVARYQRVFVVSLTLLVGAWVMFASAQYPAWVVVLSAFAIALGHAGILAAEFALLIVYGTESPERRPKVRQILAAWISEVTCAARVFGWRQPWRSTAISDWLPPFPRTGAVLVHGFFCNRGFWNPWMARLRRANVPYVAVNLEPPFGAIDSYSKVIDAAVLRITEATGRVPVVVAHSMGGLAVRCWLARYDAADRVGHVFTIGTPHRGTWLARFSTTLNGTQMQAGSRWLRDLGVREASATRTPPFVCYYSNCDNIVFPASLGTLPGADNRRADGLAHVCMAFAPTVVDEIVADIERMQAESCETRITSLPG